MKKSESILVVKRNKLFGDCNEHYFEGFRSISEFDYRNVIYNEYEFLPRELMENDKSYQQIIPYCIFEHGGNLFLFKRTKIGGESRLHEKYSIGVGGHINITDDKKDVLANAMEREFNEEVEYCDRYEPKLIGFLNDDSDAVGRVHFGVVFLLRGSTPNIRVRETKVLEGSLVDIKSVESLRPKLESWSKLSLDCVKNLFG